MPLPLCDLNTECAIRFSNNSFVNSSEMKECRDVRTTTMAHLYVWYQP